MRRIIAASISLLIMVVIFLRIDLQEFSVRLSQVDVFWLVVGILFVIPQTLVLAWRWQFMIRDYVSISLTESLKLVLAASSLNLFLPSKMGDLAKGYFLKRRGQLGLKRGTNIVIFERYTDLMSLSFIILIGVLFRESMDKISAVGVGISLLILGLFPLIYIVRSDDWVQGFLRHRSKVVVKFGEFIQDTHLYLREIQGSRGYVGRILLISIFLWALHLLQFSVIFLAFHTGVSIWDIFLMVPLAILIGLVPITLAGIGTRDSALIYFFGPLTEVSRIVGIGLFATLRYLIPGLLGLPFLNEYIVRDQPPSEMPNHE